VAPQFKNRLVGVTILVALVVIFLPSVIDGKKNTYQQEFVTTPIKPALKQHSNDFQTTELKEKKLIIEDALPATASVDAKPTSEWKVEEIPEIEANKEPDSNTVVETATTKTTQVQTSKVDSATESKKATFADPAWTIQLGAFQNKTNINALLKKLNKAGFQVHTIPKEVMEGQLTRVFVGPDVSKQVLEEKLPQLKRLTNLNGKLVPFNPIEP